MVAAGTVIGVDKSLRTCSKAPKKNTLSFFNVPPVFTYTESRKPFGFAVPGPSSVGRAFSRPRRKMYAPSPCNSFVPDFVIALNTVPTVLPNSGEKPLFTCWISARNVFEIGISRIPARSLCVLLLPSN